MMYRSYANTGGNVNEEIKLLNSISHVSAKLARNLSLLAASQSEEGGKENVKDGRNGTAAASINAAADWLYQQFSGDDNEVQATEAPTKKEPKPELKLEDVRAVLAEKSRAGHTAEVRALLKKYGAAKLSEIDPTNYEALMKDAEVIGNGS